MIADMIQLFRVAVDNQAVQVKATNNTNRLLRALIRSQGR